MTARTESAKFSSLTISAVEGPGEVVSIGKDYRTRDGVSVRKVAYLQDSVSAKDALYQAVLTALTAAARADVRRFTVYVDDPQVAAELARRAPIPPKLQSIGVQVRCRANALGRVRFCEADPGRTATTRELARQALAVGQPISLALESPRLPLGLSGGPVA